VKFSVKLKMYDGTTGKCFATLLVSVKADNQRAARKLAKEEYAFVLRGSPAFTFDNFR
jgi:hypothetical protein